jgi:3-phosphoshikimate 1-carboxyvinyltransferase
MRQRPIKDLCDALEQLGVSAETSGNGCPPVHITGGGIPGGHCRIKGTLSSQFLSALLMAAPYAASDVTIEVDGDLVSKPYVDMTLSMMEDFGITAENHNYESFNIPARQTYLGRDYAIEPDASNASYFLAAAAVTGGTVTVEHLGTDSIQGDIAFVDVLEMMGCIVSKTPHSFTVTGPAQLLPIDFDATRIPDMAQTLAVAACFASGPSRLSGLKTLRVKETDRISAMATELRKIGVSVIEGPESLLITPPPEFTSAAIDTYDDHRMAMSFAVAGLKVDNLVINDPGCVAKTFPDFWNRWDRAFPGSIVSF